MKQPQPALIPVYILDDDQAVCDSLRFALEGHGVSVSTFCRGQDFIQSVELDQPGVVILDYRMPEMNGYEVHSHLLTVNSVLSVIYLTSHGELSLAVNAFRDGACDFFEKPVVPSALISSIRMGQLHSQKRYWQQRYRQRHRSLTKRESEVFSLVVRGLMNKQIAGELNISLRTVEVHRARVMKQFDVRNVTELVRIADLLQPESDLSAARHIS